MVWLFLILAAVALAFTMLGALSVWVIALSIALKAMLAAAVAVPVVAILYGLLQKFYGRKSS